MVRRIFFDFIILLVLKGCLCVLLGEVNGSFICYLKFSSDYLNYRAVLVDLSKIKTKVSGSPILNTKVTIS